MSHNYAIQGIVIAWFCYKFWRFELFGAFFKRIVNLILIVTMITVLGCRIGKADSYVFDVIADIRYSEVREMHMMVYHVVEDFETRVFSHRIPSSVWCKDGMVGSILKLNNMRIERESNREAFFKIETYIRKVEEIDKLLDKLYYDIYCDSDYCVSLDDQRVDQICSLVQYLTALGK